MEKAKILIVEDEAIIAMELESQLQSLGYEVTSIVNTGENAIKKAEEDNPDLILMDIRIKGEMDGIDAAETIRSQFGIPVIFSTAYLDQERIERAKITMPFGYVLKPFQERDLKVTLEMALYVSKVDVERRKSEEALKKSESRLNRSEKIGKIGNYEYDLVTGEIVWSDQVFDLYERDPKIGPPSDDEVGSYYSEEDHMRLRGYIQQIVETGGPVENFECPVNLPSGRTIICVGSMFPIKDSGTVIKIYGVLQDITKRKQAEKALNKSEDHLKDIINSISHPFHVIDVKTRIIKHASKETGLDAVGKTCYSMSYDSPIPCDTVEHSCPIDIILKTKKPTVLKHVHLRPDGSERLLEVHASPLFDDNGEVEFIVESNIEISERK